MSPAVVIERLRERGLLDEVRAIAKRHHTTLTDMCGPTKTSAASKARFEAWHWLRQTTSLSYPEIGALWDRDHVTVMDGVRRAQKPVAKVEPVLVRDRGLFAFLRVV